MYATKEDYILIEKFILYPLILTILDRDIKVVEQAPFKLKQPYITLVERVMTERSQELFAIKKELRSRKIRVDKGKRLDDTVEYNIFVRGYHEVYRYSSYHLRNKSELLIEEFFTKMPLDMVNCR
jgi:hypothetical protein